MGKKDLGKKSKKECVLSICLITKNEEKTLRRCLESLVPLMKALPCELIITDTGSTDNTVAVAKEYTDKVGYFKWIDDFSAARNHGLKQAKGEWLMWLDADMWFEGVDKIINFFQLGYYKKARCAEISCRHYMDEEDRYNYLDIDAVILFENFPGIKFLYKIHETIPAKPPKFGIDEICFHSGYNHKNNLEKKTMKFERNLPPLLEEYRENPEDLRTIRHLVDTYKSANKMMEGREYFERGYALVKNSPTSSFYAFNMKQLCLLRYGDRNYSDAKKIAIEFLDNKEKPSITDLDFYYLLVMIGEANKEFEETIKWGEKFLEKFVEYKNGLLSKEISSHDVLMCISERSIQEIKLTLAISYHPLNDGNKKAAEIIESVDIKYLTLNNIISLTANLLKKGEKDGDYTCLCIIYKKMQITEVKSKKEHLKGFTNTIENYLITKPEYLENFSKAFADECIDSDDYIRLQKIRSYDSSQNYEKAKEKIAEIKNVKEIDIATGDLIFYLLKYKQDLRWAWQKIEEKGYLVQICNDIIEKHRDTPKIVKSYLQDRNRGMKPLSLNEQLILSTLLEQTLLKEKKYDIIENIENFRMTTELVYSFVNRLYSKEVLNDKDVIIFPAIYAFSYYSHIALTAQQMGDNSNFVKYIKLGHNIYPHMLGILKVIADNVDALKNNKKLPNENKEFLEYAEVVKKKIREMIEKGFIEEARPLIEAYEKINVKDRDIIELKSKAGMLQ